jgi:hypothetical protein
MFHMRRSARDIFRASLSLAALFAAACVGEVGEEIGAPRGSTGASRGSAEQLDPADASFRFSCSGPNTARGRAEPGFRRLTSEELARTFEDLLGASIFDQLKAELALLPEERILSDVGEFQRLHAATHARVFMDVASKASRLAATGPELSRLAGSCAVSSPSAPDCVAKFVESFGLRAFRRPPTPEETRSYVEAFQASGGDDGWRTVVLRMLLSPSFLFHIENGTEAKPVDGRIRLTDYEVASRISYRLTSSMPDAELFAAADRGDLRTLDNIEKQVQRLLRTPHGQDRVRDFFRYWVGLDTMPEPHPESAKRLKIEPKGLETEMVGEMEDFLDHVIWKKRGNYQDLVTSDESFPRTTRLAAILGTDVAVRGEPVPVRDRAGLILRPALLLSAEDHTSPIVRGVRLRTRLLCDSLQSPDPDIIETRLDEVEKLDRKMLSTRQIVTEVTSPAQCSVCHADINPLGFTLESYDELGVKREKELVYEGGKLVAQHPIETRVANLRITEDGPPEITSAQELVAAMAKSVKGPAQRICVAIHIRCSVASDHL